MNGAQSILFESKYSRRAVAGSNRFDCLTSIRVTKQAVTFSTPFKDQSGAQRNGTSFGLNDLEALMNVAFEAKEWITAHTLKR